MSRRRILIADDDEIALTVLELSIEYWLPDCQIVAVEDGAAALTELTKQSFDLVLTDYQMPRLTGLDIAWAAQQIYPNVPVILMSGGNCPDIQSETGAGSAISFLAKPYTVTQLGEALRAKGLLPAHSYPLKTKAGVKGGSYDRL